MKKAINDLDELAQELPRVGAYLSFNGGIELIVKPESEKECFTLIDYKGSIEVHNTGVMSIWFFHQRVVRMVQLFQ